MFSTTVREKLAMASACIHNVANFSQKLKVKFSLEHSIFGKYANEIIALISFSILNLPKISKYNLLNSNNSEKKHEC